MPFFLFSSVKMKRGEKLSLLLCDRWKEEKYYLKYYGVALLFFLLIFQQQSSDVKETKLRLSKLVREVDKCIALLNE